MKRNALTSRGRRPARGATLVEAMAALVVFTIGILGVLQMNVLASAQTSLAKEQTLAASIARDLVEAFERLPYNHPAFTASGSDPNHPSFIDPIANTDTLHDLEDDFSPARPISSLVYAAAEEAQGGAAAPRIAVLWRVAVAMDPTDPAVEEARRIAIMIRYPTRVGVKQVTVWTAKFNPSALVGSVAASSPEI